MSSNDDVAPPRYRLAPGIEVVAIEDEGVLFASEALRLRLDGASARFFAGQVLPLLDGTRNAADIAQLVSGISVGDLEAHLHALAEAGVLVAGGEPAAEPGRASADPLLDLLSSAGLPRAILKERLSGLHVAVFGLESTGPGLAESIAACGVGALALVDPWQPRRDDPGGATGDPDPAGSRQDALARSLSARFPSCRITTPLAAGFARADVEALATQTDLTIGCFDRDYLVVNHWINRAAIKARKPALFAQVGGFKGTAGPFVLPGETPCYMCYRMRALACEDAYAEAMAIEEARDKRRTSSPAREPTFLPTATVIAGLVAAEFVKVVTAVGVPLLAGAVAEYDALKGRLDLAAVLSRPDCPICASEDGGLPPMPGLSDLGDIGAAGTAGSILALQGKLVHGRTGVIRKLTPVVKDPAEPAKPYVYRAELANSRFHDSGEDDFVIASGKGHSEQQAKASALGEAVERYSAGIWDDQRLVRRARRAAVEGPTIDPASLVLYGAEQYATLPYTPYSDDTVVGWVEGRSLADDRAVSVPAMAALMSYRVRDGEAYLMQMSSNGLAAGRSLAEAALRATLEVLERDAFMATWLLRLPAQRVDAWTHPEPEVVDLVESYRRRGVDLELYRVPTDHVAHVFIGLGVAREASEMPAIVVGLGADLQAARAARSALLEVAQVRPALRGRLRAPETQERLAALLAAPETVDELEDHDLLYASHERRHCFDFLRSQAAQPFSWPDATGRSAADSLTILTRDLAARGDEVICVNLTSPDMSGLGLHTVRAIVPGYQPIYFGHREARIARARLDRLAAQPGRGLNPDPHPLS